MWRTEINNKPEEPETCFQKFKNYIKKNFQKFKDNLSNSKI